jgi:hypothetical protein
MLTLTRLEAEAWCRSRGVPLNAHGFPAVSGESHEFAIPVDAGQRVHLVASDLSAHLGEAETLVWYTEWGVWPSGERPHIFERFRASYGETRHTSQAPAHVFGQAEGEDLLSFVTLGVLFLWDVHVVIPRKLSLFYSHDERGLRYANRAA